MFSCSLHCIAVGEPLHKAAHLMAILQMPSAQRSPCDVAKLAMQFRRMHTTADCSHSACTQLARDATACSYDAGEVLCQEEEQAHEVLLLLAGSVSLHHSSTITAAAAAAGVAASVKRSSVVVGLQSGQVARASTAEGKSASATAAALRSARSKVAKDASTASNARASVTAASVALAASIAGELVVRD